jgi:hypothetical protein
MAQNVYLGLAVSGSTSTTYTATFDDVSIASTAFQAPPAITAVSATTGAVRSQVVVSGSGFGASQGSSAVLLDGTTATINSWSDTSITITIPSGGTSGDLVVSVAPGMNDSNPVYFTVTGNPLPAGWLDLDIRQVAVLGSAGYSSNVFTVQGGGGTTTSPARWEASSVPENLKRRWTLTLSLGRADHLCAEERETHPRMRQTMAAFTFCYQ